MQFFRLNIVFIDFAACLNISQTRGVALHSGTSFPVGKVEFMDLYPLSFTEFMQALGARGRCENLNSDKSFIIRAEGNPEAE
jgi:hypothetical protein